MASRSLAGVLEIDKGVVQRQGQSAPGVVEHGGQIDQLPEKDQPPDDVVIRFMRIHRLELSDIAYQYTLNPHRQHRHPIDSL